jgi:hypothetical protein
MTHPRPIRRLAVLLPLLLLAGPASAGKIRITPAVQKEGMRNDLPAPQQSNVKVRDVATGKVVATGTVPGAGDSRQFKTGEIVVPPGKYDVEVHMREGTSQYKDVERVNVGPGKSSKGVTPHLSPMSNQEIREHEAQNEIDKVDRRIAKSEADAAEYRHLSDRAAKLGNQKLADKWAKKAEQAEAKKATQEKERASRQAKLDEMQEKDNARRTAQDNVRRAAQGGPPRVDPQQHGPNVPTNRPPTSRY